MPEYEGAEAVVRIWLRRWGFARGALRRRSDRAEVVALLVTVVLTIVAVPVGSMVEDMTYTQLSTASAQVDLAVLQEQASAAGLIASMLWLLLVVVAHRLAGSALEQRRFALWDKEWEHIGR